MLPSTLSPDAARWLIALWLFALGGVIGSFLNVVVYRLPAGMSLLRPGSHCPSCKRPIRWYDNVPILGWLFLFGRCRDCGAAISLRYPVVEALTAVLFLTLGLAECLSGGANLPLRPMVAGREILFPEWTVPDLWRIYAFHLVLLGTLLAAALIEYDHGRVPSRLFLPALLLGLLVPPIWPRLYPLPWAVVDKGLPSPGPAATYESMLSFHDGIAGLLAGLPLGWLLSRLKRPSGLLWGTACVGLFLGWQAAVGVAALTAAMMLLLWGLGRWVPPLWRIPPTAWLALVTLGWILAWNQIMPSRGCPT
jgi:leader peptidase (prepilin peptidase)/N-methyltransferase